MKTSDGNFEVAGADKVREWFGYWPDFHDAEIISLSLSRYGESVLRVYPYAPDKPASVEFLMKGIVGLELWDFSNQNVISRLAVEPVTGENGAAIFRLELGPCYGLAGHIDAEEIRVELNPGKSSDGISSW